MIVECPYCGADYEHVARQRMCRNCATSRRSQAVNKPRPGRRQNRQLRYWDGTFRAIDGEGIGDDYVMLSISDDVTVVWPGGLKTVEEVFTVLYGDFLKHPHTCYVGFYLTYDFNHWLKSLPFERANMLLNPAMVKKRARSDKKSPIPFPVYYHGWEFDILWGKRLRLRPRNPDAKWMTICDAGPFFQMSLLKALKTRQPTSKITDEDVALIEEGKARRSHAELDEAMARYNKAENRVFELLMGEVRDSLDNIGIHLTRSQYHGPGQAAQKWIKQQVGVRAGHEALEKLAKDNRPIYDAIVASYYGGIFEITTHGNVPGDTFEYDINSAYPNQIAQLPCVCGQWERVTSSQFKRRKYRLILAHVQYEGGSTHFGPLPHREHDRSMTRPRRGAGWYWLPELEAAKRMTPTFKYEVIEAYGYIDCGHEPPVSAIRDLYNERLKVGKNTSMGKGCKLVYNSTYGKFAQSVGHPVVSNAVYASLITSGCRVQIMDAIATHKYPIEDLLMVATDAVFFRHPHDGLKLSSELGDYELEIKHNLTLFKPGVYWDDESRRRVVENLAPSLKSRGVNAKDLAQSILSIDDLFSQWSVGAHNEYPALEISVGFAQLSLKAAVARAYAHSMTGLLINGLAGNNIDKPLAFGEEYYRSIAGKVRTDIKVKQSSVPTGKRNARSLRYRPDIQCWQTLSQPVGVQYESEPYDGRFGAPESPDGDYCTEDFESMMDPIIEAIHD